MNIMPLPPLLTIPNYHAGVVGCEGGPPSWIADGDGQLAYYENVHGEQWIARVSPSGVLITGGDIGWATISIDANELDSALAADPLFRCPALKGRLLGPSEWPWVEALIEVCREQKARCP